MLSELTKAVLDGKQLTYDEALPLLHCDLEALCAAADTIRQHFCGTEGSLCTILNGKSGRCSENCKFCAQSACYETETGCYDFLPPEQILAEARQNEAQGIRRFCIVTAGRSLTGEGFSRALEAFRLLRQETDLELCASFGLMTAEQLQQLYAAGARRCHCNLETSRRFFPEICTTHTYDQKLECLRNARSAGLSLCSGGIIGMGETWEDRLSLAAALGELGVDSIPLNVLIPIKGTPLEGLEPLTEAEILRTVAIFRFLNPRSAIRMAAGRSVLPEEGAQAFRSGANAAITGNMLTTTGSTIRTDIALFERLGFELRA